MTGRMLLIVLAGLIVSTIYLNMTLNENEALESFVAYYNRSKAYEIAYSGFNIAKGMIYFNNTRNNFLNNPSSFNKSINGGKLLFNVNQDTTGGLERYKVTVIGRYPESGSDQREFQIIFWTAPTRLNEFLMFLNQDGRKGDPYWFGHETADGAVHSNRCINVKNVGGSSKSGPKFWGGLTVQIPAAATGNVTIDDGRGNKINVNAEEFGFLNTYDNSRLNLKQNINLNGKDAKEGVFHKMNMNFETQGITPILSADESYPDWNRNYPYWKAVNGQMQELDLVTKKQVHLRFFVNNGKTYYQMFYNVRGNASAGILSKDYYGNFQQNDPVYEVPQNGVLLFEGFDVFVQGEYCGKLSVISKKKTVNGQEIGGNIIIREKFVLGNKSGKNLSEEVRYSKTIRTDIKDMAGLFAEKNCLVGSYYNGEPESYADGIDGQSVNSFKVDAAVITLNGCWAGIASNQRERIRLSLYGSIASEERGVVGQGGKGFFKFYRYDKRFYSDYPPLMPTTDKYTISAILMKTTK